MNIIAFMVGTIFGAFVSGGALVLALMLAPRAETISKKYYSKEMDSNSQSEVMEPTTYKADAIDEILKRNEERGVDTPLSEIY